MRDAVLSGPASGANLHESLSDAYDLVLADVALPAPGTALVAVGGFGRREVAPFSDVDLVLVSGDRPVDDEAAAAFWRPFLVGGIPVDHATRTISGALAVAEDNLPALLGMLWARPVAGDRETAVRLREAVRRLWRSTASRRVGRLAELCARRWQVAGDAADALEPDLKTSRGALRDAQIVSALAVAQLVDYTVDVRRAYRLLLDVRGALHRAAGRRTDTLYRQFQVDVAARICAAAGPATGAEAGAGSEARAGSTPVSTGAASVLGERTAFASAEEPVAEPAADVLLRAVHVAARSVSHEFDAAMRRAAMPPRRSRGTARSPLAGSGARTAHGRTPLAPDLVCDSGEIAPARDVRIDGDPLLILRAARVAATTGLAIAPYLLRRFAERMVAPPTPWPEALRDEFVRMLGGASVVEAVGALDVAGLMTVLMPDWEAVRGRPQHSPVHRHTVDRHLLDTVAAAHELTRNVDRPDLLLIAALLHDIGKVGRGDHAEVGGRIAARLAEQWGFVAADRATIALLVRHHLLLVDTATARDVADPGTVAEVVGAVGGSRASFELLCALTEADAMATGPLAWTPWRRRLVWDLVERVRAAPGLAVVPVLPLATERGGPSASCSGRPTTGRDCAPRAEQVGVLDAAPAVPGTAPSSPAASVASAASGAAITDVGPPGEVSVVVSRAGTGVGTVIVGTACRPGSWAATAGVIALHRLEVRAARVENHGDALVSTFDVRARFGGLPDATILREDLRRTLATGGDLLGRLARVEQASAAPTDRARPPEITWLSRAAADASPALPEGAMLVEVRGERSVGLLARVAADLDRCGDTVVAGRIETWGDSVIATFAVLPAEP